MAEAPNPCAALGRCACRHPITDASPDYHWLSNAGEYRPRWRNPYKGAPDPQDWFYTSAEVALQTGFSITAICGFLRDGRLKGVKATQSPRGEWRVRGREVTAFMKGPR